LAGSAGGERELGGLFGRGMVMRAARATGLGAGAQGLVDDGLDGTRAAAAFGAAAKTTVELLDVSRQVRSYADGIADIVVAEDVTGTDNHENRAGPSVMQSDRYWGLRVDAKGKTALSSNSKLIRS
jgi:hypothetical protein